jgi:hypothetical protein
MVPKSNGSSLQKNGVTVSESRGSNRNILRGICELARLHKPELTLLAWYPSGANPILLSFVETLKYTYSLGFLPPTHAGKSHRSF